METRTVKLVSVPSFGDSFFIVDIDKIESISEKELFPSPHSGILFLCRSTKCKQRKRSGFPSPHSGILFLCRSTKCKQRKRSGFPSPHSGILFLCGGYDQPQLGFEDTGFRPLIRGFFFYVKNSSLTDAYVGGFRPLIRGFFFYVGMGNVPSSVTGTPVSVPSFGDSFFIKNYGGTFRLCMRAVSVPSFGDSFFIMYPADRLIKKLNSFPSPHSGILFLYAPV